MNAFRLWGHFQVATAYDDEDPQSVQAPGVIDISFAEQSDGTVRAFLTWQKVDVGVPAFPSETPATGHSVFGDFDAADALLAATDKVNFWISLPEDESETVERRVFIRGAIAFQQFAHPGIGVPELLWPCVAHGPELDPYNVSSYEDDVLGTWLVLGQGAGTDWNSNFRLDLAVPSPVQFNQEAAPSGRGSAAIGVSGVFASRPEPEEMARPAPLLTGLPGDFATAARNEYFGTFVMGARDSTSDGMFAYADKATLLPSLAAGLESAGFAGVRNRPSISSALIRPHWDADEGRFSLTLRRMVAFPEEYLDLTGQTGGFMRVGTADALCELEYSVELQPDDLVARLKAGLAAFEGDLQLSFRFVTTETVNLSDGLRDVTKLDQAVPRFDAGGLYQAIFEMNRVRAGLLPAKSGPQSVFPDIHEHGGGVDQETAFCWKVHGQAAAPSRPEIVDTEAPKNLGNLGWAPPREETARITVTPLDVRFEEDLVARLYAGRTLIEIRCRFENFVSAPDLEPPRNKVFVLARDARADRQPEDRSFGFFALEETKDDRNKLGYSAQLGALNFTKAFTEEGPNSPFLVTNAGDNALVLSRRVRRLPRIVDGVTDHGRPLMPALNARLDLSLAIDVVDPVTTDIAHGDRSRQTAPLLIREPARAERLAAREPRLGPMAVGPMAEPAELGRTEFILKVSEQVLDDQDWHLQATLLETSRLRGAADERYTVLSFEPFSLYRFSREPLTVSGQEDQPSVAEYDSDERSWRFSRRSEDYQLTLQPAVTGDAADKPHRLEIHDPAPAAGDFPEPVPEFEGVPRTHVVDSRFAPPVNLWVRPTDLTRNAVLPEFAGYDLFRQAGDFGRGVSLAGMTAEFLYGLSVGINPGRETGPSAQARVAELDVLYGRHRRRAPATPAKGSLIRWLRLQHSLRTRPEHLEIWNFDSESQNGFVSARFSEGTSFALRHTAFQKPPVEPVGPIPSNPVGPRFHDRGLPGGALWPLESWNIARALVANPTAAPGGTIERIALAPHGGTADQTARFLGGVMTIISETRNGFVQKQRVEILGRISVFWHRAKHVVIYERTTAPSDQFAPDEGHETRTERPALRKVEEFVEILQPVRSYPDYPRNEQATAGFLEEVRFNSKIIHVDSAWGGDVGTTGWRVPLWNRGASNERPLVYPFPDIAMVTLGEGDDDRPRVVQECLDPANIYFFTDAEAAQEGNADTDSWDSREGLDYSSLGSPVDIDAALEKVLAGRDGVDRGRRPSSSRILPGMRPFTWRLAPAPARTQLNAGRSAKPVYGGLESITFMRTVSFLVTDDPIDPKAVDVRGLAEFRVLGDSGNLASVGTTPQQPPVGRTENLPEDSDGDFGDLLNAARDSLTSADPAQVRTALMNLANSGAIPSAGQAVQAFGVDLGKLEDLRAAFRSGSDALKKFRDFDADTCDRLKSDASRLIERKRLIAVEAIRTAQGAMLAEIDKVSLDNLPGWSKRQTRHELRELLTELVRAELDPHFARARVNVGNLQDSVEVARAIVRDWRQDAAAGLARARARVDAVEAGFDNAKPWSINRIEMLRQQVLEQVDAARAEVLATLDEARQRLAGEIEGLASRLSSKVSRALAFALGQAIDAELLLTEVAAQLQGTATQVRAVIDKVRNATDQGKLALHLLSVQNNTDLPQTVRDLAKDLEALRLKVVRGATDLSQDVGQLNRLAQGAITVGKGELVAGRARAQSLHDDSQQFIEDTAELSAALVAAGEAALAQDVEDAAAFINATVNDLTDDLISAVSGIDFQMEEAWRWIDRALSELEAVSTQGFDAVEEYQSYFASMLQVTQGALSGGIQSAVERRIIAPVVDRVLGPFPERFYLSETPAADDVEVFKTELRITVGELGDRAQTIVQDANALVTGGLEEIDQLCRDLAGAKLLLGNTIQDAYDQAVTAARDALSGLAGDLPGDWRDVDPAAIAQAIEAFDYQVRDVINAVGDSTELARDYSDRIINAAGSIGKRGIAAGPNNVLRLYSAVSQAPELAALKVNMDRIRVSIREADRILQTPALRAGFDKLGDALKALGIEIPFSELGDTLKIDADELAGFDIGRCFGNFGGLNLSDLFSGLKMDRGWADYIDITHQFDKKAVRAWVQIDVDVPIGGRRTLFSIGPFTLFLRNARFSGFVRVEASKDTEQVTQSDFAVIRTDLEAVVAGQVMVTLQDVRIEYTKDGGLDFKFDPKNIKINEVFRFIQDTLGTLFPGEFGGLRFVKQAGIPVGIEHEFKMPPVSLNFGTSGVSNLAISNRFSLVAYPDFVIANRFNLSRVEQPFIFSIFIIGGAGYIQVDTEYRPFDKRLMVVVEASAGGSAALAFSFGPVSGGVYITLSVALTYRKLIGQGPSGGGLSVSLVLVIAGNVSLWGMVHVFLSLVLRMTYHSNGQIDALGSLSVEVRISRFFKLKFSTTVRYKLRDGQSRTQVSSNTQVGGEAAEIAKKAGQLNKARKRL
ncbi:MAG: hypothetical protein AAF441_00040 [Pseudomonadota bacterium]